MSSSRLCRLHSLGIYPCNLQYKRGSDAKRPIHPLRIFSFLHLVQYVCLPFSVIFGLAPRMRQRTFIITAQVCVFVTMLLFLRGETFIISAQVCGLVTIILFCTWSSLADAQGVPHILCAGVWVRDCDTSWGQRRLARQSATAARFKMALCVPPHMRAPFGA